VRVVCLLWNEKKKKQRSKDCTEIRERRESIFMIKIKHWEATVQPNALDCTVAFSGFRKHIGYLLWVIFCDFFDIFPKFRRK
jgi:hypothetical protein